jgi:hypothetical protein
MGETVLYLRQAMANFKQNRFVLLCIELAQCKIQASYETLQCSVTDVLEDG